MNPGVQCWRNVHHPRWLTITARAWGKETRQPEGHYTASVYMLKEGPDSRYPLVPVQEAPEGEVIWRRVPDSPMDLDIYL